jgi:hypothetical protein
MMGERVYHPGRLDRLRFYTSAALSAARSVTLVLRAEFIGYLQWRDGWLANRLTAEERAFFHSMKDRRDEELHARSTTKERPNTVRHMTWRPEPPSGEVEGLGFPLPPLLMLERWLRPKSITPPPQRAERVKAKTADGREFDIFEVRADVPVLVFENAEGRSTDATGDISRYLAILDRLVTDFKDGSEDRLGAPR